MKVQCSTFLWNSRKKLAFFLYVCISTSPRNADITIEIEVAQILPLILKKYLIWGENQIELLHVYELGTKGLLVWFWSCQHWPEKCKHNPRGVLSGKVGTGRCSPDFSTSQVYQWPFFYLKIGLDTGCILAKCLIFDEFFL